MSASGCSEPLGLQPAPEGALGWFLPGAFSFPFYIFFYFPKSAGTARCLWRYQQGAERLTRPDFQRAAGIQWEHAGAECSLHTTGAGHPYFGSRMAFCCFVAQRKLLALIMLPCRKLWPVIYFFFFFLALFFIKWS